MPEEDLGDDEACVAALLRLSLRVLRGGWQARAGAVEHEDEEDDEEEEEAVAGLAPLLTRLLHTGEDGGAARAGLLQELLLLLTSESRARRQDDDKEGSSSSSRPAACAARPVLLLALPVLTGGAQAGLLSWQALVEAALAWQQGAGGQWLSLLMLDARAAMTGGSSNHTWQQWGGGVTEQQAEAVDSSGGQQWAAQLAHGLRCLARQWDDGQTPASGREAVLR